MKFVPNATIKDAILQEIGQKHIDELFVDIPEKLKVKKLDLSEGLSQQEVDRRLRCIAQKNLSCHELLNFLGGGVKPHYLPPAVKAITSRAELYTAYTPYQSEASQGFLQAMFEYQSMIAELAGMDIANASLYDGATAVGEAALMSARVTRKKTFIVARNVSWEKRSILKNYTKGAGMEIREAPYDKKTGTIDIKHLKELIDSTTAGIYCENPNFFGVFEEQVHILSEGAHDAEALFVVGADPLSLGVIKSPGEYGADIVIGEGRSLGNPMDFGGSTLGIFACKQDFLRQMPGRVIGMTKDIDGNRGFCMTLQTREQHIRRGRATSNICTNEGLCALAAVAYLSWLGGQGLEAIGRQNIERGQTLLNALTSIDGFTQRFSGTHFNECVVQCSSDGKEINKNLLQHGVHGGLPLNRWYPELKNCLLFGISEIYSNEDIDKLQHALREVAHV
ncbi:MAG: aminomethyl-transferring glycine dehydrogenase subunit GcvPA [Candidatus Thermoplasmatota archaeon]|nr:aminomethyl-transferring glycine dehydrogenase subunit GcvPA [Candidatus Thermoplasmatota archaeon]